MVTVEIEPTFDSWQGTARALLSDGVSPGDVQWRERPGAPPAPAASKFFRVPPRFLELARRAAAANNPARWATLYDVLWRIINERRDLFEDRADPAVRRLHGLAAQGRREGERAEQQEVLRLQAEGGGAASFVPAGGDLPALAAAAKRCEGCPLHRDATQTVFGRGRADARIVLVGEQPGDQEDLRDAPFVGPAGEVLDRALAEVRLDRDALYVTNAVKHFKFVMRGKRRIHQTPRLSEISACRPWVEAELALIKPDTLVCLGATAARALLGDGFRLMRDRGRVVATRWAPHTLATLHPSAVLRGEDDAAQKRLYRMLVDDLSLAAQTGGGAVRPP